MSGAIAPVTVDASHLDSSAFEIIVAELGRDDTVQMFAIFFTDTDKRLSRLRQLSCDSWEAIEREAHGLKGSAGNFGLRQVSQLAAGLEQEAQVLTPARYDAALRSLEISYAAARKRFEGLVG